MSGTNDSDAFSSSPPDSSRSNESDDHQEGGKKHMMLPAGENKDHHGNSPPNPSAMHTDQALGGIGHHGPLAAPVANAFQQIHYPEQYATLYFTPGSISARKYGPYIGPPPKANAARSGASATSQKRDAPPEPEDTSVSRKKTKSAKKQSQAKEELTATETSLNEVRAPSTKSSRSTTADNTVSAAQSTGSKDSPSGTRSSCDSNQTRTPAVPCYSSCKSNCSACRRGQSAIDAGDCQSNCLQHGQNFRKSTHNVKHGTGKAKGSRAAKHRRVQTDEERAAEQLYNLSHSSDSSSFAPSTTTVSSGKHDSMQQLRPLLPKPTAPATGDHQRNQLFDTTGTSSNWNAYEGRPNFTPNTASAMNSRRASEVSAHNPEASAGVFAQSEQASRSVASSPPTLGYGGAGTSFRSKFPWMPTANSLSEFKFLEMGVDATTGEEVQVGIISPESFASSHARRFVELGSHQIFEFTDAYALYLSRCRTLAGATPENYEEAKEAISKARLVAFDKAPNYIPADGLAPYHSFEETAEAGKDRRKISRLPDRAPVEGPTGSMWTMMDDIHLMSVMDQYMKADANHRLNLRDEIWRLLERYH